MFKQKINLCLLGIIVMGFSVEKIQTAELVFYKDAVGNYVSAPLNDTGRLVSDPAFNLSLITIIYAFGFTGSLNDSLTGPITNAYLQSDPKRNVMVVNWEVEAQSSPLGPIVGYTTNAAPNAYKVGQQLGPALIDLQNAGVDLNKIYLVGHSLGAHLVGYAAEYVKSRGILMPRILGMDPAGPGFDLPFPGGVSSTSARFVVVIHTNQGKYGTVKARGTVDFWPNYSILGLQPGCAEGNFTAFVRQDLCSHNRVIFYVIESIRSPTAFLSASAPNFITWSTYTTLPNNTAYMGDSTDTNARGNYFLRTNGQEPYSKGPEGALPQ